MAVVAPEHRTGLTVTFLGDSLLDTQESASSINITPSEIFMRSYLYEDKNRLREESYQNINPHERADKAVLTMIKMNRRSQRASPKRSRRPPQDKNKPVRDTHDRPKRDKDLKVYEYMQKHDNLKKYLDFKENKHYELINNIMAHQNVKDKLKGAYLKHESVVKNCNKKILKENISKCQPSKDNKEKHIEIRIEHASSDRFKDRNFNIDSELRLRHESPDMGNLFSNGRMVRDVEVRYVKHFLDCLEKFKSCYDCTPEQCPLLEERLNKHRALHHKSATTTPIPPYYKMSKDNKGQTFTITTPTAKNAAAQSFSVETPASQDNDYTQTKITIADLGKFTISIEPKAELNNVANSVLKPDTLTHVDPLYHASILSVVRNWMHKLPTYTSEDHATVIDRERILNTLVDDIAALAPKADIDQYKTLLDNTIAIAIRNLNLKYPMTYEEESVVKRDLHNNLLARIVDTNKRLLGVMPTAVNPNRRRTSDRKVSLEGRRESRSTGQNLSLLRENNLKKKFYINDENENAVRDIDVNKDNTGAFISTAYNIDGERGESVQIHKDSPKPGVTAVRDKTESTITLGKDRKKTSSMKSLEELSIDGSSNNIAGDKDYNSETLYLKEETAIKYVENMSDVSSGYAANTEGSSAISSVADKAVPPVKTEKHTNNDGTLDKQNGVNDDPSFMGQRKGKNYTSRKHSSPNSNRRTTHQKSPEPYSRETCQRNINMPDSYLGKNTVRCTIGGQKACVCPKDLKGQSKKERSCRDLRREMEFEVVDWISSSNTIKFRAQTRKKDIINAVIDGISVYLDKPYKEINKSIVKAKLAGILKKIGIEANTQYLRISLDKIIDELTDRLIIIKKRTDCSNINNLKWNMEKSLQNVDFVTVKQSILYKEEMQHNFMKVVMKCLNETNINNSMLNTLTQLLVNKIELIETRRYKDIIFDIQTILKNSGRAYGNCKELAERIIESIKDELAVSCRKEESDILNKPLRSRSIEMYFIENDYCESCPCKPLNADELSLTGVSTSISKMNKSKRDIQDVRINEKAYMDEIATVIENWLDKVGNFNQEEHKELKKVMLYDLASEIVDYEKLNQLAPNANINQHQFMHYHINKWLIKFEIFDDVNQGEMVVNDLAKQLQSIDVPDLTKSGHGSEKVVKNSKLMKGAWVEEFAPKGVNFIEDKIYNWLSKQNSEDFSNTAPLHKNRQKYIRELSTNIRPLLGTKDKKNIKKAIKNWLKIVTEPNRKIDIEAMSEELANIISKLSQNSILTEDNKMHESIEKQVTEEMEAVIQKNLEASKFIEIRQVSQEKSSRKKSVDVKIPTQDVPIDETDIDTTMKECILKYIYQNYEVDDALTRAAYAQLLKTELQKLSAMNEKGKNKTHEKFSPQKLDKELQYIRDISDWLKNLPIEGSYNVIGNKNRIKFINNLTKSIVRLEEERIKNPNCMNFNLYNLGSTITKYTEQLPLLPGTDNVTYMVNQLISKVVARRNQESTYSETNQPKLTEFIDQYVRYNEQEIASDELKLEAWSARLLEEIQKIVNEPDTTVLNQSKKCRKLSFTPMCNSGTVDRFQQQLEIAKEIVDWSKNLRLLESTSDTIVLLTSDLAQKISAAEANKSDTLVKKELDDYVDYWFTQLPLDKQQDVDKAVAVEQLMNRIRKVTENKFQNKKTQLKQLCFSQNTEFTENTGKAQKIKSKKLSKEKSDPGHKLVKAIENWSRNLSFDGENTDEIKTTKNNIATKLYQKINALNDEPRFDSDSNLFTKEIGYEVDNVLKNLPGSLKLKGDQNALKQKLLIKLENARKEITQIVAGDDYKAALDATIDSLLPNPIPKPVEKDPGYDMYKKKLTDIFILENFDYSTNEPNRKYENNIKSKIDQLSQSAQKRNATPLSKEDIYNELYSSMFKVPIPNEKVMTDKVEEAKTRCEIDSWFDELPIRPPQNLVELQRWDQILDTLAKRIHYIEKVKSNSTEKIHKEITEFLLRFPLLQNNIDDFANKLVIKLKASDKYRKCVKSGGYVQKSITENMYPTVPLTAEQLMQIQSTDCKKRGVDVISDMVEAWCNKLPITASIVEEENAIRDSIATDILKKLSELNSDSEIFECDIIYDHLLSKELDKIFSKLPQNIALDNKELRKEELIQGIKHAKHMLKEERIRHYYVEDLRLVVITIIPMPQSDNLDHDALYEYTMDKIINNFIEYSYNRDDEEAKHFYKAKIFNDIRNYLTKVKDEADPLVVTNNVVCNMAKLAIPKDCIIREGIEEIRMRDEVKSFLNEIFPVNNNEHKIMIRNQHINSLTKILCWIEKCGHNMANEAEMKKDVLKTLKKLKPDQNVDDRKIDNFIQHLRESEPFRKAFPIRKALSPNQTAGVQPSRDQLWQYVGIGYSFMAMEKLEHTHQEPKILQKNPIDYSSFKTCFPPTSSPIKPNIGDGYPNQTAVNSKNFPSGSVLAMGGQNLDPKYIKQMNQTVEYPSFGLGFPAASTPQPKAHCPIIPQVTTNNSNNLLISHPTEGTVVTWHSADSGAKVQHQKISAILQDPLLISHPAEDLVEPWNSSASGAQLQAQNISARIHNAPGPNISMQPFLPPPRLSFTNTSTLPGVYVPPQVSNEPHIQGTYPYYQPFSMASPKIGSTFAADQGSSTVPSFTFKQWDATPSPQNPPNLRNQTKEHTPIKEPFRGSSSPELLLNIPILESAAVPSPIPTGLAVPGSAFTPNILEGFRGAGLSAPASISKRATASQFTQIRAGEYGQQKGIASGVTSNSFTNIECKPCFKYFKKRRTPYNCIRPLHLMHVPLPCFPCTFLGSV